MKTKLLHVLFIPFNSQTTWDVKNLVTSWDLSIAEECQGRTGGWGSGPVVRHHRASDQCKQRDCMLLLGDRVLVGYWRARRYPVQCSPTGRLVNPPAQTLLTLCLIPTEQSTETFLEQDGSSSLLPSRQFRESACKISVIIRVNKALDLLH